MEPLKNKYIAVFCGLLALMLFGCGPKAPPKVYESPPPAIPSADGDLFQRALKAQDSGQFAQAEKYWKRFLRNHPSSYEGHNNLGEVYYMQDKLSLALKEFETAYELEPISHKIRENYERVLKFQLTLLNESKDYHKVVDGLRRLKEIVPEEEKEGVQFKIERVEDKIYEDVQRSDSLQDYRDFLARYPDGVNAESARQRLRTLENQMRRSDPVPIMEGAEPIPQAGGMLDDPTPVEETSPIMEEDFIDELPTKPPVEGFFKPAPGLEPPNEVAEKPEEKVESGPQGTMEKPQAIVEPGPAAELEPPLVLPGSQELGQAEMVPQELTRELVNPESAMTQGKAPSKKKEPREAPLIVKVVVEVSKNSYLNVRAAPSPSGKVVGKLHRGDIRPYVSERKGWFQIEFIVGKTGWVSQRYSRKLEWKPIMDSSAGDKISYLGGMSGSTP